MSRLVGGFYIVCTAEVNQKVIIDQQTNRPTVITFPQKETIHSQLVYMLGKMKFHPKIDITIPLLKTPLSK